MPGRILTLQRQARELGRLRTGYSAPSANGGRDRPVRSETWIVSSHAEHYVQAAAAEWGGTVERWQPLGAGAEQWRVITEQTTLDAILPPGDPLSQYNELWNKGGCARRCDGLTELLSDQPCVCRADYGDSWHEQAKGDVCSATTRLNVILPQMPDVGVWRAETHSYYAANEIAAHVDLIRGATGGQTLVPIRLRIEQRQRVAEGKTKKYPVIAVELRGSTAGQVLSGTADLSALPSAAARPALPAGPASSGGPSWQDRVDGATTRGELVAIWEEAKAAGVPEVEALTKVRAARLGLGKPPAGDDLDGLWAQVVAGSGFDTTAELESDFWTMTGVSPEQATAEQMRGYLDARTRTGSAA
jgi:hypothetical protein